ncbi:MAG: hypothetical protein V1822_02985 [Candidatus Micrarchaeota archaeon]
MMERGQTSIEYVISLSVLLLIFIGMYELAHTMDTREQYLASYFEGEKIAAKLSNTVDWALILGDGSSLTVSTHSSPNETIIAAQAQVIAFGPGNRIISISPAIASMTSPTGEIPSNQYLGVSYDGTSVTISQLG